MSAIPIPGGAFASAHHSAGAIVLSPDANGDVDLVANQTYYMGIPLGGALLVSAHFAWDAALIATITIEDSNFPAILVTDATAGRFIKENPSAGVYVPIEPAGSATLANMTLSIPGGGAGGAAGGAIFNLSGIATSRARAKVVVGATGGKLRLGINAKG